MAWMAASSAARLSDIGFSLVMGSPWVFRRTRQYIPAAGPELIAPAAMRSKRYRGALDRLGTRPDVDKSLAAESGRQTERREDLGILEHRIPADARGGDGEDLERVQLVPVADAPIGGEPGLAVGRDGLQLPVRSRRLEDPLHEQAVVAWAGEPVEHWRHLHEHVLGEQPLEPLDVGVLERLHVAVDPGALLGGG